jgi:hypothetical protein
LHAACVAATELRSGRARRRSNAHWRNDKPRLLRAGFVGEKEVVECGCAWPQISTHASLRDPQSVTLDPSCAEARHRGTDSTWRRIIFFRQREPQVTVRLPLGSTAAPHILAIILAIILTIILAIILAITFASSSVQPSHSLFGSPFRNPFGARHLSVHRLRRRAPSCDLWHARRRRREFARTADLLRFRPLFLVALVRVHARAK